MNKRFLYYLFFYSPACLYCHPFLGLHPPRAHPPVPLGQRRLWDQENQPHPEEKCGHIRSVAGFFFICLSLSQLAPSVFPRLDQSIRDFCLCLISKYPSHEYKFPKGWECKTYVFCNDILWVTEAVVNVWRIMDLPLILCFLFVLSAPFYL